ncbi:hypothetical protein Q7C36_001913 [Tachysurus vachellii]|uniref:Uncharacterized protein n=1 Tax=Tachysurus vachellii TaxID=175792 RepID=A0AA88NWW7_TACVA|nr:hypothetical protein Q7C36_001913 [Tachysurus vachellii]
MKVEEEEYQCQWGFSPSQKEEKPLKRMAINKVFINISIGMCILCLIWFFYALYMRSALARRVVILQEVQDLWSQSAAPQAPIISLMFYITSETQVFLQAHIEDKTLQRN